LKGTDSHDSTPGLVAFLHCLTKYKKHHPLWQPYLHTQLCIWVHVCILNSRGTCSTV
jgi:hypothetical protein